MYVTKQSYAANILCFISNVFIAHTGKSETDIYICMQWNGMWYYRGKEYDIPLPFYLS